ncbi:MAG: Mur ligase family protein [Collinsella sp.]
MGHEAATIDEVKPDVVVVSTAIPESNPELVRAASSVFRMAPCQDALGLGHGYTTVAVAGTHGKTTTSSMCATMLDRMGLDRQLLIGGIVEGYDTNGKNGSGDYFVAEADESDSSFLFLNPNVVIVTNVEADHLDHYSGIEEIESTLPSLWGWWARTAPSSFAARTRIWSSSPSRQAVMCFPMALPRTTTSSAYIRMSRASRATLSFA